VTDRADSSDETLRARLAALADPAGLLAQIFASTPMGLQIYARDGRTVLVNGAHTELFGGVPPPEYNIFEDTILEERGVVALVRRAFAGERISVPAIWYDIRQLRNLPSTTDVSGGKRIAIAAELVPLRDERGEVSHVLVVFNDQTATEEARELAEAAAASADRARVEAEAASRAKDEFLAMLGHELRNPLAPIVTALELAQQRTHELDIIERQVGYLRRLVDDLLDVARITRGTLELARAPLALADVVADAIEAARPLVDQRGHQLFVDVPRELVAHGDRARLAQVVTNLVTNAARYTPAGGRIDITGTRHGRELRLVVRDTGAGIPPELVPRVFEIFTRGMRVIDRSAGGLGLGLAIVKSLTEMHGGRVAARSEGAGRGSELEIVLPAHDAPHAAPAPRAPRAVVKPRAARVLVVDDNVDAAVLLADGLAHFGFTPLVAHDGASALDLVRGAPPQLAIVDIRMPGMDGYELAAALHALPGAAVLPIVAVTGFGQSSDRSRSERAGFAAHLVKPVQLDTLVATLDRLLA
jgi:signal transduction histidine kinase/CheY-like chemotaxis protein